MHIKFINRGTGSAKSAKEYLLQEHDYKGEIRADVQVLRGNPDHVTAVADSLEFKYKYTSGVIAWHKDDAPTDEQIDQVLDDFERVAFAGLDGEQYCYYAVLHEESNGAKHVHIIAPRVELTTGKSMNIAPPNWQKTYDVLRDKYNTKYEWASPKDISRRKAMTTDKMQIHANTPNAQAKKMIHEVINELVERGSIKNNTDVRNKLAEFGEITREGKDYISLKPKGFKKAIRLKGAYYEREFSIERVSKEVRAKQEARIRTNQADRNREYERISEVFESIIDSRAEFNRGRYDQKAQHTKNQDDRSPKEDHRGRESHTRDTTHEPRRDRGPIPEPDAELEQDQAKVLASSDDRGVLSDRRANTRELRPWELDNKPIQRPTDGKGRGDESRAEQEEPRSLRTDQQDIQERDRGQEGLQDQRMASRQRFMVRRDQERAINDTVRERVKADLESTRRAIQERATASNTAVRKELAGHQDQLRSDHSRSADHHRGSEPNIERVRTSKSEHKDTLRRSAGADIDRASAELKKPLGELEQKIGLIGRARQELSGAIKQCVEKAIVKVKEIAKKAELNISSGWSMSR